MLYDKCSIHSFPENEVLIPLVVLDELDRFKDKKGLVGENARYVNRYLDKLREQGHMIYINKGVKGTSYRIGTPTRAIIAAGIKKLYGTDYSYANRA